MLCENLVQSASLYSHRTTRRNALVGKDKGWDRTVLTQHGWRWSIKQLKLYVCLFVRMRKQLSKKEIYEHVHAHVCMDLCMQRWAYAGMCGNVGVCARVCFSSDGVFA